MLIVFEIIMYPKNFGFFLPPSIVFRLIRTIPSISHRTSVQVRVQRVSELLGLRVEFALDV